jgi:hypothetical protein
MQCFPEEINICVGIIFPQVNSSPFTFFGIFKFHYEKFQLQHKNKEKYIMNSYMPIIHNHNILLVIN